MPTSRRLIVGNWKMHGLQADLAGAKAVAEVADTVDLEVAICVPATLIERMRRTVDGSTVSVGGQDLHSGVSGPFTGDISAAMLVDAGAGMVIAGHSERRAAYGENDAQVAVKARAAVGGGLVPIICVGETAAERDADRTLAVIHRQVVDCVPSDLASAAIILAYEPVWAIGHGVTPSLDEIAAAHATLRGALNSIHGDLCRSVPLLFGGSVDAGNVSKVMALRDVNGVLVGGASLDASNFISLLHAADTRRIAHVDRE
ncbi:triose-phosphate isomerase [Polymorphobacter megasporae]|uniref:triose-phosphate isomerase n=1 Tax=Glacieibacterium megasporae TaxID=2835787 RepID=UPI001C1E6274|nr:triose-phosphate isomerase [Polymorphobacter megasporae]UAJ10535.1 triose-phosphate isomerase [Polymorphobacter megasporae]